MKTSKFFSIIIVFLMILICRPIAFAYEVTATIIPTGTTAELFDVWSFDANTAYAVGAGGVVLKYNGSNAVVIPNTSTSMLKSVSGCSATEVWAVGSNGTAIKINASSTTVYNVGTTVALRCVKVFSPNDIWACGANGVIVRWNGSVWTSVSNPYTNFYFVQILGASSSNMYFVGEDLYSPYTSRIFQYNGTSFTEIVNDPSGRLWCKISTFDDNLFYLFGLDGTYTFTKSTGVITEVCSAGSVGHYAFDANTLVMCGWDSIVKYDGANWTRLENLPVSNAVFAPQNDGSKVFFAGPNGIFYYSNLSVGISPEEPLAPSEFNVYPNPASSNFTIDLKFEKEINANINIYDLLGQKVIEVKFEGNEFNENINVSNLKPGTYLLKIGTTEGGNYCKKLVITR